MNTFYKLLVLALLSSTTNNFVWFALTFWVYLQTQSVVSTSVLAGLWVVSSSFSGIWFGAIVDHYKKKIVMMFSSLISLTSFSLGLLFLHSNRSSVFTSVESYNLWILVGLLLLGIIVGGLYQISVPTLIPKLVPTEKRDRANGMFGTVIGISFAITSVASGLVLAYYGFSAVLTVSIITTLLVLFFLFITEIRENHLIHLKDDGSKLLKKIDLGGTFRVVKNIPGLFSLIFFTTFNNFLGGVFMALMDAYGLTLVSVQFWGAMWGVLSFGFIFGGIYISKFGLGQNPLKSLFTINIILWIDCILFTIQPSILLLGVGMMVWMSLVPFVEATEQTVLQKVVPHERLGRVLGFAQTVEQAASPVTAFLIGPLAEVFFIPFMTSGRGADLIGPWFGTGPGRGIALVFILAGVIGLLVTLVSMNTKAFSILAKRYSQDG